MSQFLNRAARRRQMRGRPAVTEGIRDLEQQKRHHAANARQAFPMLRDRLLKSRPVVEEERVVKHVHERPRFAYKTDKKTGTTTRTRELVTVTEEQTVLARYGKPTFKNAVIEGKHQ